MSAIENAFVATLVPRERRLAGRLESCGDIVFGFAVSQCAIQLPTVNGHVDLANPLSVFAYFGTFGVLVSFWLTFHRMISGCFRPARLDLVLAFSYLAFVSLVPFAMYSLTHRASSLDAARTAFAEYAVIFAAVTAVAAGILWRNLRRGWFVLDQAERGGVWQDFLRRALLSFAMLVSFALDVTWGLEAGLVALVALSALLRSTRRRIELPSADRLRIERPAAP